jgi:Glu-tRNA(Gln) amidotransferase subunit E-like FAD-binding protein
MDYSKLGLKAGLEIHQQLDSGKLFSRTPSLLRKEAPDWKVSRRLHAVAGESGEVDVAVSHEASLDKEFVYEGYDDTISLVELDEAPPRPIDEDALDIALQISLLLNCEIVPISQIMRKTVIDGSNTGGFQRTVLLAKNGFVETESGRVGIWYVYLEEDAARIVSQGDKKAVYRLDRLGIPLVEIVTAPDITSPEQAKEVALHIGELLRACRVKRGLGTIRQDVNVSIKGHPRAEIKGFQDPKIFVSVVEKEVERQLSEMKKKGLREEVRGALPSGETKFLRPLPSGARMYPETDLPLLRIGRERINELKKDLPRLRGDIKSELGKSGLNSELVGLMVGNPEYLDEFSVLSRVYPKDVNLVGKMISLWRGEFASKTGTSIDIVRNKLNERVLEEILEKVRTGEIAKGDVKEIMAGVLNGEKMEDLLKKEKISDDEIEEEIRRIVKEKPGLRPNAYMGLVMAKLKGKIDAKKAMEIIDKIVGE